MIEATTISRYRYRESRILPSGNSQEFLTGRLLRNDVYPGTHRQPDPGLRFAHFVFQMFTHRDSRPEPFSMQAIPKAIVVSMAEDFNVPGILR
jgi:hypothetical protein